MKPDHVMFREYKRDTGAPQHAVRKALEITLALTATKKTHTKPNPSPKKTAEQRPTSSNVDVLRLARIVENPLDHLQRRVWFRGVSDIHPIETQKRSRTTTMEWERVEVWMNPKKKRKKKNKTKKEYAYGVL